MEPRGAGKTRWVNARSEYNATSAVVNSLLTSAYAPQGLLLVQGGKGGEAGVMGEGAIMRNFTIGFCLGLLFGVADTALAATIVGGNGWLIGWGVVVNGEGVCDDPYVWVSVRQIECD